MERPRLLNLPRSIRDPIHGTIHLSNEEVALIDQPLFSRLHRIRQNGLLYLVFPSSTHTRFEHSLGVLHVADSAFRSLLRNSHIASDKPVPAVEEMSQAGHGQAVAFHKTEDSYLRDLLRVARLAALVHDAGHGPFSHHFDPFAPRISEVVDGLEEGLLPSSFTTHLQEREGERVEHEEMSCLFFAEMWRSLLDGDTVEVAEGSHFGVEELPSLVSAVILGEPELVGDHDLHKYIPLLNDLIASAPVDVDRMDYLERDSRSAGVTYGLYDRERLLKSFLVYEGRSDTPEEFDALRLGIKYSGLRAVENFVQARFELFTQIYYHKTNRATQLMLGRIATIADREDLSVKDLEGAPEKITDLYCKLSDERFLRILMQEDQEIGLPDSMSQAGMDELTGLAERISRRDLWKRIHEGDPRTNHCVYQNLEGENDHLVKDEVSGRATKDLEDGARLLLRTESDVYEAVGHTDWLDESPMMEALGNEEKKIARIYFTGDNSDIRHRSRKRARTLSHELNRAGQ